jgi:hypothetical protein
VALLVWFAKTAPTSGPPKLLKDRSTFFRDGCAPRTERRSCSAETLVCAMCVSFEERRYEEEGTRKKDEERKE